MGALRNFSSHGGIGSFSQLSVRTVTKLQIPVTNRQPRISSKKMSQIQWFVLLVVSLLVVNFVTCQNVSTPNGVYMGYMSNDVTRAFLGIRFGENTGGVNRFRPPVEYVGTGGVKYDATTFGNVCIQEPGDNTFAQPQSEGEFFHTCM